MNGVIYTSDDYVLDEESRNPIQGYFSRLGFQLPSCPLVFWAWVTAVKIRIAELEGRGEDVRVLTKKLTESHFSTLRDSEFYCKPKDRVVALPTIIKGVRPK